MTLGEQAEREAFEAWMKKPQLVPEVAREWPWERALLLGAFQAGVRRGLELRGCCEHRPGLDALVKAAREVCDETLSYEPEAARRRLRAALEEAKA